MFSLQAIIIIRMPDIHRPHCLPAGLCLLCFPGKLLQSAHLTPIPLRMKRRFLLAAIPFALAACGFHLKGAQQANHVHSIRLDLPDNNAELAGIIRTALHRQGIGENADAAVRITISDIDNQRVRTSTGSSGDTQEIEIFDGFRATISENGKIRGSQTFTGRSNILYRSNTYLGSRAEEAEAHRQLARDNADKLIRYLNATIR